MDDYVKAATLDNLFEAQRLSLELDEKGIPYALKSYHDSAYNGLFQAHLGWGTVLSPREYAGLINQLLEQIRTESENAGE